MEGRGPAQPASKFPATQEGLAAITRTLGEGVSVNVTLIFSVERYREVMGGYLAGLELAASHGHTLAGIASVASFFVSRVDTELDKRLDNVGTDTALVLRGKAWVANSRLAYAAFQEVFSGPRWEALAAWGAKAQRPLWASTGVKNPEYSDTLYITELVVADTVNTMPEKTLMAYADHGEQHGDAVTGTAQQAQSVFDAVAALGIDLDDVFRTVEIEASTSSRSRGPSCSTPSRGSWTAPRAEPTPRWKGRPRPLLHAGDHRHGDLIAKASATPRSRRLRGGLRRSHHDRLAARSHSARRPYPRPVTARAASAAYSQQVLWPRSSTPVASIERHDIDRGSARPGPARPLDRFADYRVPHAATVGGRRPAWAIRLELLRMLIFFSVVPRVTDRR